MNIKETYNELMDLNALYNILEDEVSQKEGELSDIQYNLSELEDELLKSENELLEKEEEFNTTLQDIKDFISKYPFMGGYTNVSY